MSTNLYPVSDPLLSMEILNFTTQNLVPKINNSVIFTLKGKARLLQA
jgi:hypothetical protein